MLEEVRRRRLLRSPEQTLWTTCILIVDHFIYHRYTEDEMTNDQGSEHFDVDVVIVGGGPVGLLLAAELLLGGVSVQVIERTTEASSTIQAGSINIGSAEILARRGLLSRAREAHHRAVKRIAETMAGAFGMESEQALAVATKKVVRAGHFAAIQLEGVMKLQA